MGRKDSVRRFEIPSCSCIPDLIPRCQFAGWGQPRKDGCRRRQRTGDCGCALLPGPPCKHIAEGDYLRQFQGWGGRLSFTKWLRAIALGGGKRYRDRPRAPIGVVSLTLEDRILTLQMRATKLKVNIFHPDDRNETDCNDWLAKSCRRLPNGSDSKDETILIHGVA